MKRLLLGVLGVLLAGTAIASGPSVRDRVEASMVVTGTIGITPKGTVLGYALDRPDRLSPLVTRLIGQDVPRWTFKPVLMHGKPVAAKAKMSLRLVATPIGDDRFQVAIRSAYFGEPDGSMVKDMSDRPRYPEPAIHARVEGTVFLALRIDRAGKVHDAVAQQVNLRAIASERVLQRWRQLFAESGLAAARHWTFAPAASDDTGLYRVVRVPIAYELHEQGTARPDHYGQWIGYVPGPVEPAPWFDKDKMLTGSNDALPGDGVYGESSLSLLTPLDRS
ncbi:energy transducer TonB [Fulvimonas yonginensis]|uniref:Energy transducer TonB n=1 Tax=Fulvimonas yonginensis TaxID=1495200 RepID=A0ABU8J8H4_9GAMM